MIYVVLGMHKSGTTLVSQILHHSGIDMGDIEEGISYDKGNKYEDQVALHINVELMGATDYDILYVPPREPLVSTDEQKAYMREFIANRSAKHEDWGFKDPRTTMVYPLWDEVLPEHKIIAVYRTPDEAWPRFSAPGPRLYYSEPRRVWNYVLRWCEHNERMAEYLRNTSHDYVLMSYRDFMTDDGVFQRLQEFVGRPLEDRRRKDLYRNKGQKKNKRLQVAKTLVKWAKGDDARRVYDDLEALSRG